MAISQDDYYNFVNELLTDSRPQKRGRQENIRVKIEAAPNLISTIITEGPINDKSFHKNKNAIEQFIFEKEHENVTYELKLIISKISLKLSSVSSPQITFKHEMSSPHMPTKLLYSSQSYISNFEDSLEKLLDKFQKEYNFTHIELVMESSLDMI
jgi:hypothetical protein